jgi:hypothetical protein
MIIRDDLAFEMNGLKLHADDGPERVWQTTYFLRRISVSLLEATSIFQHDVGAAIKRPTTDTMRKLAPLLRKAIKTVGKRRRALEALRNPIGAHVRPRNADKSIDVEKKVLRQHPQFGGTAWIHPTELLKTSYRGLSQGALLLAWPDADDDERLESKQNELRAAIFETVPDLLQCIDALLMRHWWKHGLVEPPEGFEFGVFNPKTGEYEPVGKP